MAIDTTATTTYASNRYAPRSAPTGGPVGRSMSAKQRDFVATLVTRADDYMRRMVVATPVQGSVTEQMRADALAEFSPARTVAGIQAQLNRTDVTARTLIDNLVASDKALAARVRTIEANAAQRAQASGGPAATQSGAEDGQSYRTPDGRVFHAYLTQRGILCVKLWTPNGETDDDGRELGEFVYYGAARRMPADAALMTLEDAAAFGQATGTCSQCMRHLTNDESVAAGIGPVCAGRM